MLRKALFSTLPLLLAASFAVAAQDKAAGGVKGKVKVDGNASPSGVTVILRRGETEVARGETDAKGEFQLRGVAPGVYGLTLRKPGLSVRTLEGVEVRAGKMRSIGGDRLFLPVDAGSLAFIRGSVFDAQGRVVPGAQVELALAQADGTYKKIDARVTSESGMFQFRLTPERARYRLTVRADRMETSTQEIDIEGAGRSNVAVTVRPAAAQ